METKLKKIKNENYRFYYLNFQDVDSMTWLDKNTRIISFIIDGEFEIATDHWYELYVGIFDYLQRMKQYPLEHILEMPSLVTSRVDLFTSFNHGDYIKTECGLYIKHFTNINKIIQVIKRLLEIFCINPNSAYLVVEVPPKYEGQERHEMIAREKEKLRRYLCSEYVKGNAYYEKAVLVIDELNKLIKTFSTTSYDDLYLLNSLEDYRNYSHKILNNYIYFNKGIFSTKEQYMVVEWLECARFFGGDIFSTNPIAVGESYIEEDGKTILVAMKTRIINKAIAKSGVANNE